MDLNYLYFRRQVSQFKADNAASEHSRDTHRQIADAYGVLIARAKNPVREIRA